jgi:3',5'-cyclic-AMP phosphodiesterase
MLLKRSLRHQFGTSTKRVYYDKWIEGYHFIILGSEHSRITNSLYADNAILSELQLEWLEQKLQTSPYGKPIFVFLHQPIPYSASVRNPSLPNHKPARDSEGLFIQVYHNEVVVQERDFTNHCWIGASAVPIR